MVLGRLTNMSAKEVMNPNSQDNESSAGLENSVQDGIGRAPASMFRIVAVANVDGEEQTESSEMLDTSGVEPRNSMCLSDSIGDSASLHSMDIDLSAAASQQPSDNGGDADEKKSDSHPPTPSPEEAVVGPTTIAAPPFPTSANGAPSNVPVPNNHSTNQILQPQQPQLPSQQLLQGQQGQQAASRFRTVIQYQRERWEVEDKRSEDTIKSGSSVSLPGAPSLQQQLSMQPMMDRTTLTSSSTSALLPSHASTVMERRDAESTVDLLDRQESRLTVKHMMSEVGGSCTPSSPGTMTPVDLVEPSDAILQAVIHSRSASTASSHSSMNSDAPLPFPTEEDTTSKRDENALKEVASVSSQATVTSRSGIPEEQASTSPQNNTMQQHMDEVGDVLTKLQRLYGVISNDHSNLVNNYQSLKQELSSLRDEHKSLKGQFESLKKENETVKKRNQKLETEIKTLKKSTSQQVVPPSSS